MQDMIKQIVDMDQEARVLIDAAVTKKASMENELTQRREEMRNQLLARARARIAQNEPGERETAAQRMEGLEERTKALTAAMEARCASLKEQWVAELVGRVLEESH